MADALVPFVLEGAAVRGACARMDATAHDALAAHDYPPPLKRVLAELMAAAALLASSLKFRGSLIVQLAGPGPVKLAVIECDHALSLRATAQWDRDALSRLPAGASLAQLAGDASQARLAITLDPEDGPLYQGIVALESGSVAALLEHYLASSEQLESRLALADGKSGEATGFNVILGSLDPDMRKAWIERGIEVTFEEKDSMLTQTLLALLPWVLIIGAWLFIMRRMQGGAAGGGCY